MRKYIIAIGLAGAMAGAAQPSVAAPVLTNTAAVKSALGDDVTQVRWRGVGLGVGLGLAGGLALGAALSTPSYAYWGYPSWGYRTAYWGYPRYSAWGYRRAYWGYPRYSTWTYPYYGYRTAYWTYPRYRTAYWAYPRYRAAYWAPRYRYRAAYWGPRYRAAYWGPRYRVRAYSRSWSPRRAYVSRAAYARTGVRFQSRDVMSRRASVGVSDRRASFTGSRMMRDSGPRAMARGSDAQGRIGARARIGGDRAKMNAGPKRAGMNAGRSGAGAGQDSGTVGRR